MDSGSYVALLANRNYRAVLTAQFLGAINDNLFRIVASLFAVTAVSADHAPAYVALTGILFIVPFLVLSGVAGRLADNTDKKFMLTMAKAAELAVMLLAMLAFFLRSIELVMLAVLLMAVQTTFFSPARYSIMPDIVARRDLSRANGLGEMCMFTAILIGASLGGVVFQISRDQLHLTAIPMIIIAAAGLIACWRIERDAAPAPDPQQRREGGIADGLRLLRAAPGLGLVVAGISLFWGLGAMAQFNILFFGDNTLGLSESAIGLLQATLGLGIGAGCVTAGWLSGDRVHLGLAQIGMAGVALSFIVLGMMPPSALSAFAGIGLGGFAGGLFVVPMISYLHQRTAASIRGLVFATNNFLNMVGVLLGVGLVYALHDVAGLTPAGVFATIGLIALALAAASLSSRSLLTLSGDDFGEGYRGKLPAASGCED